MVRHLALTREDAAGLLRAHAREIRERGVTRMALFGSLARGDTQAASDVDVVVDVDPAYRFSLLDQAGLRLFLCDLFGCETDVVIREDLSPDFKARIAAEQVVVI